jgi:hypothetical protein
MQMRYDATRDPVSGGFLLSMLVPRVEFFDFMIHSHQILPCAQFTHSRSSRVISSHVQSLLIRV